MALELEMANLIKTLATRVQKLEMERDVLKAQIALASKKCDTLDAKLNQIGAKVGLRA